MDDDDDEEEEDDDVTTVVTVPLVTGQQILRYLEVDLAGQALFPDSVKFVIGNFGMTFGSVQGTKLRQWCGMYNWTLLWSLGNLAILNFTEGVAPVIDFRYQYLANQRVVDVAAVGAANFSAQPTQKQSLGRAWVRRCCNQRVFLCLCLHANALRRVVLVWACDCGRCGTSFVGPHGSAAIAEPERHGVCRERNFGLGGSRRVAVRAATYLWCLLSGFCDRRLHRHHGSQRRLRLLRVNREQTDRVIIRVVNVRFKFAKSSRGVGLLSTQHQHS